MLTSISSSEWQYTWISESILSSYLAKKFDESESEMQEGFNEQNKSDGPSCSDTRQHSNAENIIVLDIPLPTISPLDLHLERPHLATNFASTNEYSHLHQPRGRDTRNYPTSTSGGTNYLWLAIMPQEFQVEKLVQVRLLNSSSLCSL